MYKRVAPIVVDASMINNPQYFPKTKPENIIRGMAKPKSNTQTTVKIKNIVVKVKKCSFCTDLKVFPA